MSKKHYSPNDQRSIAKNPNNPAYHADQQNRVAQGHQPPLPPAPAVPRTEREEEGSVKPGK